jgi:formyl-CoA transferase
MTGSGHFPLSKLKVLDLTRARAGPTCVRQLVDWGAEAIKIEMPGGRAGDGMGGNRHGFDFQNLHRNKKSLTLNLKHPKGVEIFKTLAKDADVIVENYRADVKHRLGIDYESIRAINPRIVYGSISGFGQEGPYRDRPGVDQIAQGLGGLMSITGLPGQGPVRVGIPISDLCSGIFLAQGILVALLERETTGEGKWVTTSLLEAMISMLDFQGSRWTMGGEVPPQAGNNHPTGIPTGVFETQDGYINIAASGDDLYKRMCRAMDRDDLITDERFSTSRARAANREVMNDTITSVTRHKSSQDWINILNETGVPCGPINTIDKTFADEQVQFLEMAQKVNSPNLGELTILGHPVSFNGKRNPLRCAAPELGQDNETVLAGLGYSKDEIAGLEKDGVI